METIRHLRASGIEAISVLSSLAFVGAIVASSACTPDNTRVTPEMLATLNACPIGVTTDVLSNYTPECVRSLFHNNIRLVDPGEEYLSPAFEINTPANPLQLVATYYALGKDTSEALISPVFADLRGLPPMLIG